jgi:hypothetical protein
VKFPETGSHTRTFGIEMSNGGSVPIFPAYSILFSEDGDVARNGRGPGTPALQSSVSPAATDTVCPAVAGTMPYSEGTTLTGV